MKKGFLSIIFLIGILSCNGRSSSTTASYKNKSVIDINLYRDDSVKVHHILEKMLTEHLHPFTPVSQFDIDTKLYIDSIIYSPDKLRMIVFLITRNSTDKLLKKENGEQYFYNANYLFASREDGITIYDYVGFNLVYYYNYDSIKQRLHEYCFSDLARDHKFNIDDVRFWNSDEFKWVMNNAKGTHL